MTETVAGVPIPARPPIEYRFCGDSVDEGMVVMAVSAGSMRSAVLELLHSIEVLPGFAL